MWVNPVLNPGHSTDHALPFGRLPVVAPGHHGAARAGTNDDRGPSMTTLVAPRRALRAFGGTTIGRFAIVVALASAGLTPFAGAEAATTTTPGTVFVADEDNNQVLAVPAGGGTATSVANG